jgi:hypothetical protein
MNKKLIAMIVGVGMGLGSIGAASAGTSHCYYDFQRCLANDLNPFICQAVFELCTLGIEP